MKKTDSEQVVDCFKCRYFYTTWQVNNPRGCNAFGFKTKQMPSAVVLETSGEPCMKFTPKTPPPPKSKNKRGWVA